MLPNSNGTAKRDLGSPWCLGEGDRRVHAPTLSLVLPVHNEAAGLASFHASLADNLRPLRDRYLFELVFVDDGSTDDSLAVLEQLQQKDPRICVVKLSRNFGHQIAITAGLDHACGSAVIVMDADGQDPPHVIAELIERWEAGYAVVYAQRRTRQDSWAKRITAKIYYRLLSGLSDIEIPRDAGDFRLLDRTAVDHLKSYRERNRYVRGMVASLGLRQTSVLFDRERRGSGESSYPLGRMLRLATDGVTSFSSKPLELIFRLGLLILAFSFAGIAYAIFMKFAFPGITVPGWTFLAIIALFMGGTQFATIGLVGLYVGRIYVEVQQRPLYIVETHLESDASPDLQVHPGVSPAAPVQPHRVERG